MNDYRRLKLLLVGAFAPVAIFLSCLQYTPDQPLERANGAIHLLISFCVLVGKVADSVDK
ncbi:hypothetical protein G7B40_037650 [Aetokthonos hydrillicola Thurmond2011]|jgi:hypothetical protein|uniref:Uncharacterized protein n=1 Tax=Aetokthonos hydrillicola Thurmond2011 TaxID=2712845 RepID=A0AAP5IEK2_9CYAN|nr:hypothetical protein [Aetokthonos hydrillicola]MBO3461205.1 hypothetical protein [Aetokthonos hydrillicola CCALA 1050]MBW4589741.1 hypothetical protein [Aetokthonos hydrillicola CCALA 1050]MDR9900236.1 hypothetical protein [Aetokthonos hydrillicola Thurmond2011]